MLIIIDKRIPQEAKDKLSSIGEIFELETKGIVYPAISGHPDIFIFKFENKLIIAPECPVDLIEKLLELKISFKIGDKKLGIKHPHTTPYNVSYNDGVFIGDKALCDKNILKLSQGHKWIQTKQAYARCNNIILTNNAVISNDKSISTKIDKSLIVNPKEILLEGFEYGFIGGCMGIYNNSVFILGSLKYHSQGEAIRSFCESNSYSIIELYDGNLFDGGGIFFIEP